MFKKLILFIIFILCLEFVSAEIYINEIMYNPEGNDNNKEYIEIFYDEIINLTNYIIEDKDSQDNLTLLFYYENNYALIVEEEFNYTDINASIYSAGSTIGNNLNNDNDLIILKDRENKILDALSYNSKWGADGNNFSLCKLPDKIGLWQECFSTAGNKNEFEINEDYNNIKINEFLADPEGEDDAAMPGGEWIELYNYGDEDLDLEGLTFYDSKNNSLQITDVNTLDDTIIKSKNYLVVYRNEHGSFSLNNDLDTIKLFDKTNLIDEVSYSHTQESNSWSKVNDIWQLTIPTPGSENMKIEEVWESKLIIEEIYLGNDKQAKFGDNLRVKVRIYKGNSTKNSIDLYAIKDKEISKRTSFNIYKKFTDNELVIPLQIYPNCDGKLNNGTYNLFLEGLDTKDKKDFNIEGIDKSLCKEIKIQINKTVKEKEETKSNKKEENIEVKLNESNINKNSLTGNIIYESSDLKSSKFGIYLFAALLVAIIIGIIKGKEV